MHTSKQKVVGVQQALDTLSTELVQQTMQKFIQAATTSLETNFGFGEQRLIKFYEGLQAALEGASNDPTV